MCSSPKRSPRGCLLAAWVLLCCCGSHFTPQDKPSTLTEANWDRVKLGMTLKEVHDILGKPAEETKDEDLTTSTWKDGETTVLVYFEKGNANNKVSYGLFKAGDKLTKPNLDRIRIGMTEKEVYDILGKPHSEGTATDGTMVGWNAGESYMTVAFKKGKVRMKGGTGLLPSVADKLTKANWDKVKVGMTEKELYDLLGGPTSADLHDDSLLKLKWYDINNTEKYIEAEVVGGKVTERSSKGLD
jgi:outer membrane protein assembly factor BamE (lipoprotein component of BamABCDE complex)